MAGRNIARYIRVHQLEQPLENRLDDGELSLVAAVELSYLSGEEQKVVSELAEEGKIKLDGNTSKCIKDMEGEVTARRVLAYCESKKEKKVNISRNVKLTAEVYERYFADAKPVDATKIVEDALAAWFKDDSKAGA